MDKKTFAAAIRRRSSFQFGRSSSKPKHEKNQERKQNKGLAVPPEGDEADSQEEFGKNLEESLTDQEVEATFEKMLVSFCSAVSIFGCGGERGEGEIWVTTIKSSYIRTIVEVPDRFCWSNTFEQPCGRRIWLSIPFNG